MTENIETPHKNTVRDAILSLIADADAGRTVSPEDVARAVSATKWNKILVEVRAEAVRLAKAGEIAIYRKGKPVPDPEDFKGVYRLGLPA